MAFRLFCREAAHIKLDIKLKYTVMRSYSHTKTINIKTTALERSVAKTTVGFNSILQ